MKKTINLFLMYFFTIFYGFSLLYCLFNDKFLISTFLTLTFLVFFCIISNKVNKNESKFL